MIYFEAVKLTNVGHHALQFQGRLSVYTPQLGKSPL